MAADCRPTATTAVGRSSRPSSQAVPAVRAPRHGAPSRRSRSSVTTSSPATAAGAGRRRRRDRPATSSRSSARPTAGMPDDEPGRDALAAKAAVGRAIEHELDADGRRDRGAQSTDSAAGGTVPGAPRARAGRRFEPSTMSRSVSASGSGSREASARRGIVRGRAAATIGRVSLLLLVDLDGVVYRGADPVPGVAARARRRGRRRGDDVVYVTNNSMHYRADYVDAPASRWAARSRRTGSCRRRGRPRCTCQRHEPGIRRVLAVGASGLERELRDVGPGCRDLSARRDADAPGRHRWLDGRRCARCGRERPRPDADLPAAGGRGGLHPGRRQVHRHEPRSGVPDGAGPATGRRRGRGGTRGVDRCDAAVDRQARAAPVRDGGRGRRANAARKRSSSATAIGTDLAGARAIGARCILMLTGITTRDEVDALPPEQQPDAVAADAEELAAALTAPRGVRRLAASGRRAPGCSPPTASNSARSRSQRGLIGERDVERVAVDRPQLAAPTARSARSRATYSSDSVRSETVRSSVFSVTGTPIR